MKPTTVWLAGLALTFLISGAVGAESRLQLEPILLSKPCPGFSYDAIYDLQNNLITKHSNVSLVAGLSGAGCSARGVLKLALASAAVDPNRRRVLVDLFFTNPTGWTFHLGDSRTNDGWGGDASTQSRDAEVFSINTNLVAYLSDVGGSGQSLNIPSGLYSTRLTLIAGDGHLVWLPNNHNNFNYHYNANLFALNGQSDTSSGGVNYDLYLGMNQVMTGRSDRTGSGLCKVGIKFLPEY